VVALKSELAAQLAKRGRTEAADEMLAVRQLAHDLLTEVREVVRGYRMTDLDAELAGARSVLASAGVEAQMLTEGGGLPVDAQSTLGWVVREGTTNVLRHSDARSCTVSLRREDGSVVLAMENDGVRDPGPSGPPRPGSGLIGLTERLTSQGGTVVAEHRPGGRFRLTARLPLDDR
jgi:two-component system sensor histidine kinase DesK